MYNTFTFFIGARISDRICSQPDRLASPVTMLPMVFPNVSKSKRQKQQNLLRSAKIIFRNALKTPST